MAASPTRVVLVLPSATYRASDFTAAADAMGVELVVATEHRQAMSGLMGHRALVVDLCAPEAAAAAIVELASDRPVDAVVAVDDQGVEAAALASSRLGLRHSPPAAVGLTRHKLRMRRRLAEAGVPQPAFAPVGVGEDAGAVAARIGWPVVLKPLSLSASRGVIRADDPASTWDAAGRIRRILGGSGHGAGPVLLVEQFVPGAEVAVEGLVSGGRLRVLAVFDKPDPLDGPYFEETIYVTPSRLDPGVLGAVEGLVSDGAAALGLTEGPVHAEVRVPADPAGGGGVVLLEVAARSIGGLCARALRFGAGVSLEQLILAHALGAGGAGDAGPESLRPPAPASGVMMIPIPAPGRLRGVRGRERAAAVDLVKGVEITIPIGSEVVPLPEGDRYLGFIFAEGPDPAAVERALRTAHAELRFDIDATSAAGVA